MRKLLKGFLIAGGLVLALVAVGVLAINLYVQSSGTQKRLEQALSSGLKVPVHVTSTIVTPWSGLKASGITVSQAPPVAGDFLDASAFTAHFSWLGLLKHRLDASDATLTEPQITWLQSPDGRWVLPRVTEQAQPAASPTPGAVKVETAKAPPGPQWQVSVHNLRVNGATFDFWDQKGVRVLQFAGVQFDCKDPKSNAAAGHASSKEISLRDRIFFHSMDTDWSFQRGVAKLSSFQTSVGGGEIVGDAQVAALAKHSPFNVDVKFDGLDVNRLMLEAGKPVDQLKGRLKGWIDLYGNPGKRSTFNGSGQLQLDGGQMNIPIFELIGQYLQIPELVNMNLKTAVAEFRVESGVIDVDKVALESDNLQLAAHGTIGQDGKLHLDARLTIDPAISQKLPKLILSLFKPGDTEGTYYRDFALGNTLANPNTDLQQGLIRGRIQDQMNDWINSYLKKKHKQPPQPAQPQP